MCEVTVMVSSVDDLEFDEHDDGSALRRKLEKALEANKKLTSENRGYRVKDILAAGDVPLVTEDDLENTPIEKLIERAKEVQTQRESQSDQFLRTALKNRGLDEEAIDAFIAGQPKPEADAQREAEQRAAAVRNVIGDTAGHAARDAEVQGPAAIHEYFRQQSAKK